MCRYPFSRRWVEGRIRINAEAGGELVKTQRSGRSEGEGPGAKGRPAGANGGAWRWQGRKGSRDPQKEEGKCRRRSLRERALIGRADAVSLIAVA